MINNEVKNNEYYDNLDFLEKKFLNRLGNEKLKETYNVLFELKFIAKNSDSYDVKCMVIDIISKGFENNSDLLKHETAYVLGQIDCTHAVPILREILFSKEHGFIVRHEAAEGLGALIDIDSLELLEECRKKDENEEVRKTCELSIERIKWMQASKKTNNEVQVPMFSSIDPAPPFECADERDVDALKSILNDQSIPLFTRYRAMFSLRNMNSDEACLALATGFDDDSALLKHEIAYIFGQLINPVTIPILKKVVENKNESGIVRHEAVIALGSMMTIDCEIFLKKYIYDDEIIVKESVMALIDI